MKIKKIPESELLVMMFIWDSEDKEVASTEILKTLGQKYEWKKSTMLTFLRRLVGRGFLEVVKKDRFTYYKALIEKEEYLKVETKSFFSFFHKNSFESFISALHDSEEISEENLKDFEEWIKEMKE
ncbi:TPA: BlaI/MecI/CopY family transcriptional regulator [Clostridioides difficile]|nr:BlaI/MecI/CopY family transcriptional regulator [Clostridioides difficile]MDK3209797.1 BlaI/MecI/CopY family transcriptional regulator [Clostridioides difficile]CZR83051.1 Penicillinase repressor [Clostridioides difficile]CZR83197.1 Penicillinase repressor [Clostridioides difficile]HBF6010863.1 BlaI/MecI/CopY family transcriptional regulator [Clostridioides difficile]